jgi:hypothetical protein
VPGCECAAGPTSRLAGLPDRELAGYTHTQPGFEFPDLQARPPCGLYGRQTTNTRGARREPNLFPALRYQDAEAAVRFLKEALGAEEKAVHLGADGAVQHAELAIGVGIFMLGQSSEEGGSEVTRHNRWPPRSRSTQ